MIAALKALHIAALVLWCAALITLPLLLGLHRQLALQGTRRALGGVAATTHAPHALQYHYTRFRRLTHWTYTAVATPAAVVAIAAGTGLIFAAQVFTLWLLAKLACVAGMVLAHAWLGHLIVQSSERQLHWRMPRPALALVVVLPCMAAVLWLVLAKPDLAGLAQALPAWLQAPLALEWPAWLQRWWPAAPGAVSAAPASDLL